MKRSAKIFAVVVVLSVLSGLQVAAAQASTNSKPSGVNFISIWQARRLLATNLVTNYYLPVDPASICIGFDSFEFDATLRKNNREHFKIDLKSLPTVLATRRHYRLGYEYFLTDQAGRDVPAPLNRLMYGDGVAPKPLVDALNRLREFANDSNAPLRTCTERVAAWRALASKPPIPDEVREQRLLAEDAIKEKRPGDALNRYELGLEVYPTWPQGYFNAAVVAAELGHYKQAIEHMQSYLELVPDAPDAQSARDQIVIWRSKAE